MNYKLVLISFFKRRAKKLIKKYPSLKNELIELSEKLLNNPKLGESLGNNCFKVRLAIRSKGKGKSGGARIITHFYIEENTIYLLTIYDKSEVESISDKELKELLKLIK